MKTKPANQPGAEHLNTLEHHRQHWGATAVPFAEEHLAEPYLTAQHQQILHHLKQTVALRTTMLLSGENGAGKSILLGHFAHQQLNAKVHRPLIVTQASLSGSGLLAYLLEKLGVRPGLGRSHNLPRLENALARLGSLTPVIILDEAQRYEHRALDEVRLLQEHNLALQRQFALILSGDPHFLGRLHMQAHRALLSRIAVHIQVPKLDTEESAAFLHHHLQKAGLVADVLADQALELLTAAADGSARVLKHLARAAWLEASRQRATQIEAPHVQAILPTVPAALGA
jgi:general secretion pathway protein A